MASFSAPKENSSPEILQYWRSVEKAENEFNEKFSKRSWGITVQENGQVAVHNPCPGHEYVLGENVYKRAWETYSNDWIFAGIVMTDLHNRIDPKGWVLGKNRDHILLGNGFLAKSTTL